MQSSCAKCVEHETIPDPIGIMNFSRYQNTWGIISPVSNS